MTAWGPTRLIPPPAPDPSAPADPRWRSNFPKMYKKHKMYKNHKKYKNYALFGRLLRVPISFSIPDKAPASRRTARARGTRNERHTLQKTVKEVNAFQHRFV